MKEKLKKFMVGRNGIDQLSLFLTYFALVLLLILSLMGKAKYNFIPMAIVIYAYYRFFSKNLIKRASENSKFLSLSNKLIGKLTKTKRLVFGSKTHKYFICGKCKTELRIPKHKGKIRVKCPKCGEEYVKRT